MCRLFAFVVCFFMKTCCMPGSVMQNACNVSAYRHDEQQGENYVMMVGYAVYEVVGGGDAGGFQEPYWQVDCHLTANLDEEETDEELLNGGLGGGRPWLGAGGLWL